MISRLRQFGRSIFVKQVLVYVLIIVLISGVTGFLFFTTARRHLEDEIGRKLQSVARISARNTPFERLELIRLGDDQTRMVLNMESKLEAVRQAAGVVNIHVFRPTRSSLLDLDDRFRIGSTRQLTQFDAVLIAELAAGNSVHTQSYRGDRQAIFMSAYAPIMDLDGDLFAIVGVDAGASELDIIEQMGSRLYWITIIAIGVACLLALLFARSITSPVREIAHTAERLGRGEYQARVAIRSRDEVGVLAESINRMAEDVRERDAALKEMAATVAHEIRNPLNSMKLLLSLLEEELREGTMPASTLRTLEYEIGKLNRFTEEFLTYARPVTLIRDRVAVSSLVASVLDMASASARESSVELSSDAGEDGDATELVVDRLRLEQSLLNIVLNAVEACDAGGRVALRTKRRADGEGLSFIVEDTGPGVDPDVMPQIFDPFFTTRAEGTGLGLANARKIIQEHDGVIRAENRPDGGVRMVVDLPAERLVPGE